MTISILVRHGRNQTPRPFNRASDFDEAVEMILGAAPGHYTEGEVFWQNLDTDRAVCSWADDGGELVSVWAFTELF